MGKHGAVKTCPLQVDVYKSSIKDVGNWVFAVECIPEKTVFGPFEGIIVNSRYLEKNWSAKGWRVCLGGK